MCGDYFIEDVRKGLPKEVIFKQTPEWNKRLDQLKIWRVYQLELYVHVELFSRIRLFATPWSLAWQVPLSKGFFQARIQKKVAIYSSQGRSSWLRDRTCISCVSCIAGRSFTTESLGYQVGERPNAKALRRKLAQLDQGAVRRPVWVEQSKQRVNRRLGGRVRKESPEHEGLSRFKAWSWC